MPTSEDKKIMIGSRFRSSGLGASGTAAETGASRFRTGGLALAVAALASAPLTTATAAIVDSGLLVGRSVPLSGGHNPSA
jgi:hypothetical protein